MRRLPEIIINGGKGCLQVISINDYFFYGSYSYCKRFKGNGGGGTAFTVKERRAIAAVFITGLVISGLAGFFFQAIINCATGHCCQHNNVKSQYVPHPFHWLQKYPMHPYYNRKRSDLLSQQLFNL